MNKKFLAILLIVVCIFSFASMAYAADIDMSTGMVKINGSFENEIKGTRYLAKVFNPGVLENPEGYAVTEWYSFIHQDALGLNGTYDFEYVLSQNAQSGKYEIEIITETGERKTDYFHYFTDAYANDKVAEITTPSGNTLNEKIAGLLSDLADAEIRMCLNVDFELYDSLQDKSKVASVLLNQGTINTRNDFKRIFAGITGAQAVSEAEISDVKSVLSGINRYIGLENLSTYKRYLEGTDTVDALLKASGAKDESELKERLSYYVIKECISKTENWQLIQAVLARFNDVLGIDFSAYETSNYKYDIVDYFLKTSYDTTAGIAAAFTKAMTEKATPPVPQVPDNIVSGNKHPSGGGGGGGAGSVLGISPSVPVVSPETQNALEFPDVSNQHWAKEYITQLVHQGIISGDEKGNIRPDEVISRQEFVKIMVAGLAIPKAKSYVTFDDVSQSLWSYEYIQSAREAGLVNGLADGSFKPFDSITRQDLFVILGRYLNDNENADFRPFGFTDEDMVQEYAKRHIAHLGRLGLVTGFADGTVRPFDYCTRAEAFAMLCRVIELNGRGEN